MIFKNNVFTQIRIKNDSFVNEAQVKIADYLVLLILISPTRYKNYSGFEKLMMFEIATAVKT